MDHRDVGPWPALYGSRPRSRGRGETEADGCQPRRTLFYKAPATRPGMGMEEAAAIREITASDPAWRIRIRGREFVPSAVEVTRSAVPVKRPGTRGGAYFTDREAHRITCYVDGSAAPLLTSTMLGPSTEFAPIEVVAAAAGEGGPTRTITANLASYVQSRDGIRLNLVVVGVAPPRG